LSKLTIIPWSFTTHSGIREDNEKPKVFYVAQEVEKSHKHPFMKQQKDVS
jgi:hypothetical protein